MSAITEIAWTDRTWNPVRGCSLVSEGCRSCYAMKQAHRFSGEGRAYQGLTRLGPKGPTWTGEVRTIEAALLEPLSWRKPARVFVNSMSDLFHEDVPDAFIDRVFAVMALAPQHTFQILTKRPERMLAYMAASGRRDAVEAAVESTRPSRPPCHWHHVSDASLTMTRWPLPNVWLGCSVENQHFADERIPLLLQTPAAVRFISAEPLLERIDLTKFLWTIPGARLNRLHWIIVGGESGHRARPFDLEWARWLVAQGHSADVAVFVKQLGGFPYDSSRVSCSLETCVPHGMATLKLRDRKGGDIEEFPPDLKVRQFPAVCQ